VRGHFEDLAGSLSVERASVSWEGESPEAVFDSLGSVAGPQAALKEALPPERWEDLRREALQIIGECASPSDGGIAVAGDYLVVVAHKRG
jgi:hypothetical protein